MSERLSGHRGDIPKVRIENLRDQLRRKRDGRVPSNMLGNDFLYLRMEVLLDNIVNGKHGDEMEFRGPTGTFFLKITDVPEKVTRIEQMRARVHNDAYRGKFKGLDSYIAS